MTDFTVYTEYVCANPGCPARCINFANSPEAQKELCKECFVDYRREVRRASPTPIISD